MKVKIVESNSPPKLREYRWKSCQALAIDEASFGPDYPNVAIRLNNLAVLLEATNRLSNAEPLSSSVKSS